MHLSIVEISNQIQDVPKTQLDQLTYIYVAVASMDYYSTKERNNSPLSIKVGDFSSNSQISNVSL